jgi:sialic acid synthase SpsE
MPHSFDLAGRSVGGEAPCFVVFEAGPTHSGEQSAKRLVDLAAEAKADAIKFQIVDPDRLVSDRKQMFSYEVLVDPATERTEAVEEPLYDILCRRVLSFDEWKRVKEHADRRGLAFFATVEFEEHVDLLQRLNCHSIKIASHDVNHFALLRYAARTGISLQLDTGRATLGEIEDAVDVIRAEGNDRVIIHQCPSGYPARVESVHLRVITTLRQMFDLPIAYSDHSPGWEMDVAALALGVSMVEKTITENRMTRSIEHMFSLDPTDMHRFIQVVRSVELALGKPRRVMAPEERERRLLVRRSLYLAGDVRVGDRLADAPIEFRMPGYGIPPDMLDRIANLRFRHSLPAGHLVAINDLE